MLVSCENDPSHLHSAAILYRSWGWSVIPLRGDSDPNRSKAAAVDWSVYQRRLPTDAELNNWFLDKKLSGLAVVCGPVSGLVVLDFDDSACADAFARVCPDLVQTFTVRSGSRKLPHYYYRVPASLSVRTRHTAQVDLQASGAYVVAPPTRIAGADWEYQSFEALRTLTQGDVARIAAFLDAWEFHVAGEQDCLVGDGLPVGGDGFSPELSPLRLVRYYQRLASEIGRNNALFRAASLARDCGWSLSAVVDALLDAHVVQLPNGLHTPETPDQRRHEGLRTIDSAFAHPVRIRPALAVKVQGLPNSVREWFLQAKQTAAARVLDGLLMAGFRAGVHFTERVACEALRVFGIGRRAVQSALRAVTPDAQPIFEPVESPLDPPKELAFAAAGAAKTETKCFFVTGASRVKTLGGRPPQHYRMPENARLYRLLRVSPSGSDPLAGDDLRSPDSYRCALHKALIARRPGRHARRWLAARLGVSTWTSRRYDRRCGLVVQPMYAEQPVFWHNLDHLPLLDNPARPDGTFLETADGRRYPPVKGLAAHLLARRQRVVWKSQGWNYYILLHTENILSIDNEPENNTHFSEIFHKYDPFHPTPVMTARMTVTPPDGISRPSLANSWLSETQHCASQSQPSGAAILASAPRPVPTGTDHRLVERLYQQVRQRTPEHALTHSAALRLVQRYGSPAVTQALHLLDRRHHVANAAGFIITVLRGQGRDAVRPRAANPDEHAAWVERLKQSPYAHFYANADHFTDGESQIQSEQPKVYSP